MSATLFPADLGALAVQLALVAALIDAGRRTADALFPGSTARGPGGGSGPGGGPPLDPIDGGAERLLLAAVIALALAVVVVQGLGFAAALHPVPVVAAIAVVWLAAWACTRGEPAASEIPAEPPMARSAARPTCLAVGALVGGALATRALLLAPVEWDGLTYHLFYAARYLQERRIMPVELGQPHDKLSLFPGNGELVHALLMAVVSSDLLVALGMVLCWLLFGLSLYCLGRRSGLPPAFAAASGLLGATLPALASQAASSYVEPLLNFALIALLVVVHRALTEPERLLPASVVGGLAAGLAAGTKYVALPVVAIAFLALGAPLLRPGSRRRTVQALGLFAGGALLVGGGWYLRNAWATGNPLFPAPFLGLPHLERPGLLWEANLLTRWQDLAARDLLGDALFGLPLGKSSSASLGWATLLALPVASVAFVLILRDAARRWRAGFTGLAETVAALLVPTVAIAMVVTYLHVPFWGNDGWFRSGVRFAVPAAALAFLLAAAALSRLRWSPLAETWMGGIAAAVALGQAAQAGVFAALPSLARGLLVVAPPLALALLVARRPGRRGAARATRRVLAGALVLVGCFLAWIFREAVRERLWTAPEFVGGDFARAAFAAERAAPGPATTAWATASHSEFLYLFTGRRLERRVITVPLHAGPRAAWAYRDGNPRRGADRAFWLQALAEARPDLLVVSRWQSYGGQWPIEDVWAGEAGLERVVDQPEFHVYRLQQAGASLPSPAGVPR